MSFQARRASAGFARRKTASPPKLLIAALAIGALATPGGVAAETLPKWSARPPVISPADFPDRPNVFGTVAIPVHAKPTSTRWSRVMRASLNEAALLDLTANARGLEPVEQAAYVQAAVNRAIRRAPQASDCSDDGYWAAAQETLTRGRGDCFDVAIAKMEALRLLGVPSRDLYLTTGYFGSERMVGPGHESAALMVRLNDRFYVLPEQRDGLIEGGDEAENAAGFSPVITYGVGATWIHGRVASLATLTPEEAGRSIPFDKAFAGLGR